MTFAATKVSVPSKNRKRASADAIVELIYCLRDCICSWRSADETTASIKNQLIWLRVAALFSQIVTRAESLLIPDETTV